MEMEMPQARPDRTQEVPPATDVEKEQMRRKMKLQRSTMGLYAVQENARLQAAGKAPKSPAELWFGADPYDPNNMSTQFGTYFEDETHLKELMEADLAQPDIVEHFLEDLKRSGPTSLH